MCDVPNEYPVEPTPNAARLGRLHAALSQTPERLRQDPYAWRRLVDELTGKRIIRFEDYESILSTALSSVELRRHTHPTYRHGFRGDGACKEVRYGDFMNVAAMDAFFGVPIDAWATLATQVADLDELLSILGEWRLDAYAQGLVDRTIAALSADAKMLEEHHRAAAHAQGLVYEAATINPPTEGTLLSDMAEDAAAGRATVIEGQRQPAPVPPQAAPAWRSIESTNEDVLQELADEAQKHGLGY